MVEGHSVHRLAVSHTRRLAGRAYRATSPNGRFADGAAAIDGRVLSRLEARGKNLFAFFSLLGAPDVVVHVHFGMSGRWSAVEAARARPPTPTTRLQLEGHGIVSQLSAMTVVHGDEGLFLAKTKLLGEDPLRRDADPDSLWERVASSQKSIGALLMDQSYFAGVGNIFRCEILLVASVHPNIKGSDLTREQFDRIWAASMRLMSRAFTLGSIVTVEPHEAVAVGRPKLRRWLYNSKHCGRCGGPVVSWQIASRTCYACTHCQPVSGEDIVEAAPPKLFTSSCAPETLEERLLTPQKLRVPELREALRARGLDASGKKSELMARLAASVEIAGEERDQLADEPGDLDSPPPTVNTGRMRSARAAAEDKAAVNESAAVEHIAEFEVHAPFTRAEAPAIFVLIAWVVLRLSDRLLAQSHIGF